MYTFLPIFIIFILGLFIGSFLNVVIYRYQTGWGLGGRSMCLSCGKTLHWYELFPIFSYIFLRGKCSVCKSKISIQYPLVEISTAFIFVFLANKFLSSEVVSFVTVAPLIYSMFMASLLIVIAVYDIRHKIIPNALVYTFILFAFLGMFTNVYGIVAPAPIDAFAGILLPLPFYLLWLLSKGRLMGFGDLKLMMGMGFFLGLSNGVAALMISFWVGAVVSILLLLAKHSRYTMKSEVPFGPFLVFGTLFVYVFETSFQTLSIFLSNLFF
ncbi:MAG: prepilin peptidase [Candidatus Pacebacteria bacterium]|nr:prepilin peptidase [Candidatus Paceibacterota bacterium]MBP9772941.1 prepilin peptidase [Candidatus Paceibacterota bacterium]QQR76319.1 MAG: prepilin peptidase [Candidatus Nomurabacteria bacterium]